MSRNPRPIQWFLKCPSCFVKDTDVSLLFDEKDDEYYCYKCCYSGTEEEARKLHREFVRNKYKGLVHSRR